MRAISMPRTSRTVIEATTSLRASFSFTLLLRMSLNGTFTLPSRCIKPLWIELAQHRQLLLARRLNGLEARLEGQPKAGVVLDLFAAHARIEAQHLHLAAIGVEAHDGEVGDDAPHTALRQAALGARAPAAN